MAENLASKTLDFESMLPLDMLAAVASETLENERNTTKNGSRALHDFKRQSKKQHEYEVLTYDEIKALSSKSLVEKFSELTSDEMSKKYSYKCCFSPGNCSVTFKSFGNEKKAWDQIKVHLSLHLKQLNSRIDPSVFSKTPSDGKPTCSKTLEKSPKKPRSSDRPPHSFNNDLSGKSETLKYVRTPKRSMCPAKKMLKFNGAKNKAIAMLKGKRNLVKKNSKKSPKVKHRSVFISKIAVSDDSASAFSDLDDYDDDFYGYDGDVSSSAFNYSKALEESCMSFIPFDSVSYEEELDSFEVKPEESSLVGQDHNYASMNGIKVEKAPYESRKISSQKKKKRRKILPQFVIRTPRFPYVHVPDAYITTEILEFDINGKQMERFYDPTENCLKIPSTYEEPLPFKTKRRYSCDIYGKKVPKFSKKQDVTGSVLECVENRVDIKASLLFTPKSTYDSTDSNVENLENVQKVERELALKLIAKLHSKKKKQYQGPLECQICQDKHFTALATLIHHYRSHAGIKPYACNICDSTFTRQHSLNYHMLIHQNRSRFACEVCGRTFRHPSHYKEHLRRHTGETPFQCPDCHMLFKTRNTFKRHLKIQHKKLLTARGIEDLIMDGLLMKKRSSKQS